MPPFQGNGEGGATRADTEELLELADMILNIVKVFLHQPKPNACPFIYVEWTSHRNGSATWLYRHDDIGQSGDEKKRKKE